MTNWDTEELMTYMTYQKQEYVANVNNRRVGLDA